MRRIWTKRKAQLRMMESMFTLVFFAMLIGFGMFFYFVFSRGEASMKRLELEEEKMVEVALLVSQLPELQCTEGNVEGGACIDLLKLMSLNALEDDADFKMHYYDMFTFATISVQLLYPVVQDGQIEYTFEDYLPSGFGPDDHTYPPTFTFYESRPNIEPGERLNTRLVLFPINIKDPRDDQFYFGVLEVDVYSVTRKQT